MALVRATAASLFTLLVLAGCSSSPSDSGDARTPEEQKAVTNISASLVKSSQANATMAFTPKQGDCVAGRIVDDVGVPTLTKAGLLKPDLSVDQGVTGIRMNKDDADATVDAFFECTRSSSRSRRAWRVTRASARRSRPV